MKLWTLECNVAYRVVKEGVVVAWIVEERKLGIWKKGQERHADRNWSQEALTHQQQQQQQPLLLLWGASWMMESSTLKWLLIFSPSGRLQAPHPTLWTIFWSVVWLCSSSSSSSTQKTLEYLPFSLLPGWIDWLLFPVAEQECKKARNAGSRSLCLLFSSCCCCFLSVCLSACRQANRATLLLWVFGTCKRILQASSISIKSLHPGSSHRFLLLLTLRFLQKLLIHLKNTWRGTWRTKVFWWVMGVCSCWISWECFVLLWLLRIHIHIHIHAGEEEMGWEDNRGSFCRWIQTKTSWVLCMCRFLPSLEQPSSFPSVCLLCAFWKNPTSPCMASLSIKEGGEERLSCWHCRGMMMTMMSGASSWVRAHPSWWQDCESVIHCTWFSKTKSFCAQVHYLLFPPWAPFLLASSLICTHSATKLEEKVTSSRGCRWLVIWESEWFCGFPFVEDVDDDVFFWCWGFPSWFSLRPPWMDVNLLSSTMLSVFGLSQSLSDSRCFSLLLLTLIRAIEYDWCCVVVGDHRHEPPVMAELVTILEEGVDVITVCKPASVPVRPYFSTWLCVGIKQNTMRIKGVKVKCIQGVWNCECLKTKRTIWKRKGVELSTHDLFTNAGACMWTVPQEHCSWHSAGWA